MNQRHLIKSFAIFFMSIFCLSVSAQESPEVKKLYDAGVQYGKDGNYEESLKVLRQAAKLAPEFPDVYNAIGMVFLHRGKIDDAIDNFRKSLRLLLVRNNDGSGVRINLCIALTVDKKFSEALIECRQAVRLAPEMVSTHFQLAQTLRANNQIDEGIEIAEAALQRFPTDERLLNFLGSSFAYKGDFANEQQVLLKLVETNPKVSAYQVMLSENYLRFDRVEEATETARKAIELDALNPLAYYRLARVYDEIGMSEEAISALQKAVELKPNVPEIYYWYGRNLGNLGRVNEAILHLREAVRLMPDFVDANYELGKQLLNDQRFVDAIEPLRKADRLYPNDLDVKVKLGVALLESGNFDEALTVLEQVDRLRPNNDMVRMVIGVAKGRKKNVAATGDLQKRVAAYPNDYEAKKNLAAIYQYSGRLAEAEVLLLEAFKLEPESSESNNEISIFYQDTRRYDIAIKYLRRAIELKKHHVYYMSLANVLKRLGRTQEAIDAHQKAFEMKPDSAAMLKTYADTLRSAGKRTEAVEMYKKVLQVEPRNAPALFNLAILSLKLQNEAGAKQYYETLRTVEPSLAKKISWIFRLIK